MNDPQGCAPLCLVRDGAGISLLKIALHKPSLLHLSKFARGPTPKDGIQLSNNAGCEQLGCESFEL